MLKKQRWIKYYLPATHRLDSSNRKLENFMGAKILGYRCLHQMQHFKGSLGCFRPAEWKELSCSVLWPPLSLCADIHLSLLCTTCCWDTPFLCNRQTLFTKSSVYYMICEQSSYILNPDVCRIKNISNHKNLIHLWDVMR